MILCNDCGTQYAASLRQCPNRDCGAENPHASAIAKETSVVGAGKPHAAADANLRVSVDEETTESYNGRLRGDDSAERVVAPRPVRLKSPFAAVAFAFGLLALVLGGWYWFPSPMVEAPSPDPTPEGMAYVKGGKYVMGRDDGDDYERPTHEVEIKSFYIDKSEVTCGQYQKFVDATGHRSSSFRGGERCPQGAADLPVTGVNWDDANAYATWADKRLPTEEEWEFAARGAEGRLYPWGDRWRDGMANLGHESGGGLVNVGMFKEDSPVGVHDLIGNAWEWTASDLKPYPGGRLPKVPKGELKVIRGGSWKEGAYVTGTYRAYLSPRNDADYSATGFRCVRDVGLSAPKQ